MATLGWMCIYVPLSELNPGCALMRTLNGSDKRH